MENVIGEHSIFLQGNYSFGDMSTMRARARWAILADFLKEKSFQDYLGFWLGNITEQVFLYLTEFCQLLVFQSVG